MSLTDRIERLDRLHEALNMTTTTASAATDAKPLDVDRDLLVKIDRGLRALRAGG